MGESVVLQPSESEVIAKLVREHMKPEVVTLAHPDEELSAPVLVTSTVNGTTVQSVKKFLDEYRMQPERRTGTAVLTELESFIAHVNRFKDSDSAIFAKADGDAPCLLAVLDYHEQKASGEPRFGAHRSKYEFPLSDEWREWTSRDGKSMSQADFASFLEDHLSDVADPGKIGPKGREFLELFRVQLGSASRLLELSRGLTVHVGERTTNTINPATGETTMAFVSEHDKQDETVKVPGAFLLAIPVFRGGDLFQIPTRLRYRVQNGAIAWFFNLHRAPAVFDAAIEDACKRVETGTGLPLFFGSPE